MAGSVFDGYHSSIYPSIKLSRHLVLPLGDGYASTLYSRHLELGSAMGVQAREEVGDFLAMNASIQ
jgi:hypothetical protein